MRGLLADCRHALRLYRRTPVPSLFAVVVLAVAMAFVSSFLSLYVDLVLQPFPGIADSGRLVTIGQTDGRQFLRLPVELIDRIADEFASVEGISGVGNVSMPVGVERELTTFEMVSDGFFDRIGPRLALGRGFDRLDHDPDAEHVAVISDRYWREQYDASPDVLGNILEVGSFQAAEDGRLATDFRIVGVMAPAMDGVMDDGIAFWVPFENVILTLSFGDQTYEEVRAASSLRALARLRPGVSAAAFIRELADRYAATAGDFGLEPGFRISAMKGVVRDVAQQRDAERQLRLFLAGSILLALVAAANTSLFLLARAPGRRQELAIRLSVGAPLQRIARQLATESALLVLAAAALGTLVSFWLVHLLRGLSFFRQAQWTHVSLLDWRVLGLIGIFLMILTVLVSLAPIAGLKRLGLATSTRQVAARATLAQRVAGTVQIVIAGVLGGAAIAFAWFLAAIVIGDPGFAIDDRYLVEFDPSYVDLAGARRQRELIESLPGVRGFTITSLVPAWLSYLNTRTLPDPSDPSEQVRVGYGTIDSRYLDVLELPLLRGRAPTDGEGGVALVNQALAEEVFGRDNVVGESLDMTAYSMGRIEIVGVLQDLSLVHPAANAGPILFVQPSAGPDFMLGIIDSSLTVAELRRQLQSLVDAGELDGRAFSLTPLTSLRNQLIAPDRARSYLVIATASLVVLLAGFGFYGTQSYLVAAGRREYAIRASLGAGPRSLGWLVCGRALLLGLPGLVTGALLAFIAVVWLRDEFSLREVSPVLVTSAVGAGLVLLVLAATIGPAREARRTQPAPLLRED